VVWSVASLVLLLASLGYTYSNSFRYLEYIPFYANILFVPIVNDVDVSSVHKYSLSAPDAPPTQAIFVDLRESNRRR